MRTADLDSLDRAERRRVVDHNVCVLERSRSEANQLGRRLMMTVVKKNNSFDNLI